MTTPNQPDTTTLPDDSEERAEHLDAWLDLFRRMPSLQVDTVHTTIDGERVSL